MPGRKALHVRLEGDESLVVSGVGSFLRVDRPMFGNGSGLLVGGQSEANRLRVCRLLKMGWGVFLKPWPGDELCVCRKRDRADASRVCASRATFRLRCWRKVSAQSARSRVCTHQIRASSVALVLHTTHHVFHFLQIPLEHRSPPPLPNTHRPDSVPGDPPPARPWTSS